jgi:hypothetical protein
VSSSKIFAKDVTSFLSSEILFASTSLRIGRNALPLRIEGLDSNIYSRQTDVALLGKTNINKNMPSLWVDILYNIFLFWSPFSCSKPIVKEA